MFAVTLQRRDVAVAYVHLWGSSLFGLSSSAASLMARDRCATGLLCSSRGTVAPLAYSVLVWGGFMGVRNEFRYNA